MILDVTRLRPADKRWVVCVVLSGRLVEWEEGSPANATLLHVSEEEGANVIAIVPADSFLVDRGQIVTTKWPGPTVPRLESGFLIAVPKVEVDGIPRRVLGLACHPMASPTISAGENLSLLLAPLGVVAPAVARARGLV